MAKTGDVGKELVAVPFNRGASFVPKVLLVPSHGVQAVNSGQSRLVLAWSSLTGIRGRRGSGRRKVENGCLQQASAFPPRQELVLHLESTPRRPLVQRELGNHQVWTHAPHPWTHDSAQIARVRPLRATDRKLSLWRYYTSVLNLVNTAPLLSAQQQARSLVSLLSL